jgi:drug/metabolite transporter (DMT)-like permease
MTLILPAFNDYRRGLALTVSGTVLVSFEALFLRLVEADIWSVIWWRGILLGITTLGVIIATGRSLQVRKLSIPGMAAILAFAAAIFFFVTAINGTTVANTLVIASAAPLFAAILSWWFLQERTARTTWGATLMLFVGIAIIFSGSVQTSFIGGDVAALAYAGCLAAYYVALRRCPDDHLLSIVAFGGLLSALLVWPIASPLAASTNDLWLLLILGVMVVPASTLLLSLGTRFLPAPHITLIMMLEMILGPLWVWLALNEVPSYATLVGGVLVVTTVVGHSYVSERQSMT